MDWLTKELVISVVSLAIAGLSALFTRGNREATKHAADAAESSAKASNCSAKTGAEALEHSKRLVSLELVKSVKDKIAADREMQNMLDNIEAFKLELGSGSDAEKLKTLNGLLSHFAVIANAWKYNLVNDDSVCLIVERLLQVMNNEEVKTLLEPPVPEMKPDAISLHESSHKALMELVDHFSPEQKKHGTGT